MEENTALTTHQEWWIKWLLNHAWTIITKEPFFKGRLSRGEYWTVTMILLAATAIIGLILSLLWWVGETITLLVWIVSLVYQINFSIRRSHDLDKSWWYWYKPLIAVMAVWIIFLFLRFWWFMISSFVSAQGSAFDPQNIDYTASPPTIIGSVGSILNRGLWLVALWFLIWMIIVWVKITFFKGSLWDNKYWADRLINQPQQDGSYWIVGILLLIINIVISTFNPNQQTPESQIESFLKQQMWVQTGDENTINYPRVDSDNSVIQD